MRDESNDCVRRLIARSLLGIGAFRQQDGHVRGSRIRQGVCNLSSARWTGPENGYCLPVLLVRLVSQRFRLTPDRAYLEIGGDGHVHGGRIRSGMCNNSPAEWTSPETGYCLPVLLVRLMPQRLKHTPDRAYLEIGRAPTTALRGCLLLAFFCIS